MSFSERVYAVDSTISRLEEANNTYLAAVREQGEGGELLYIDLVNSKRPPEFTIFCRDLSILAFDMLGTIDTSLAGDLTGKTPSSMTTTTTKPIATRLDLIQALTLVDHCELNLRQALKDLHVYIYRISGDPAKLATERTAAARRCWGRTSARLAMWRRALAFGNLLGSDGMVPYACLTIAECVDNINDWVTDMPTYLQNVTDEIERITGRDPRKHGILTSTKLVVEGTWGGVPHFSEGGLMAPSLLETYIAEKNGCWTDDWWNWPPDLIAASKNAADPRNRTWVTLDTVLAAELFLRPYGLSLAKPNWCSGHYAHGMTPTKTPVIPSGTALPPAAPPSAVTTVRPMLELLLAGFPDVDSAVRTVPGLTRWIGGARPLALPNRAGGVSAARAGAGGEPARRPSPLRAPDPALLFATRASVASGAADAAAVAARRAVSTVTVNGVKAKCRIVFARGDGNCAFTATQLHLSVLERDPPAGGFNRHNVINQISLLYANRATNGLGETFEKLIVDEVVPDFTAWQLKFGQQSTWMGNAAMHLAGLAFNLQFEIYQLDALGTSWEPVPLSSCGKGGGTCINLAYLSLGGADCADLNHYDAMLVAPTHKQCRHIDRLNRAYAPGAGPGKGPRGPGE